MEWLKTVQESHGSVAMTSLVQAKTINSSGIYQVGHLNTDKGPSPEQRLSFKDVIRLTVPLKDGSEKEQRKTYSIDELKDLQSKLVLIAGKAEKGKDDVEQFVRVSKNTIMMRKLFFFPLKLLSNTVFIRLNAAVFFKFFAILVRLLFKIQFISCKQYLCLIHSEFPNAGSFNAQLERDNNNNNNNNNNVYFLYCAV